MAHARLLNVFVLSLGIPAAWFGAAAAGGWRTAPAAPTAAELPTPAASVIATIGDPAPGVARVRGPWQAGIALTPDGGTLYGDTLGSALYHTLDGETRVLLHIGDPVPGLGNLGGVAEVAAGGGTIAALVGVSGHPGDVIVRVAPEGGVESVAIAAGETLALRNGPVTIAGFLGVAVDGAGRIVTAAWSLTGSFAIVRRAPGSSLEILVQPGDPLGTSTFAAALTQPGANGAGDIVFDALTAGATHVLSRRSGGGALVTLFEAPVDPSCPPNQICVPAPLGVAPPAINDTGDVAFLWSSGGAIRAQRVLGGLSETVAAPGSPAPSDGTFTIIADLAPAIDAAGGVVFGAHRSSGVRGIYRTLFQPEVVAEEGAGAGDGRQFVSVYVAGFLAAPIAPAGGTIVFAARDTVGDAIFARAGALMEVVARAGDPVAATARFVDLFAGVGPHLSAGPSMAPNADVIFDARITGGGRGLYARRLAGPVRPIALDGDAAPGGGRFDGEFLLFHSINDDGMVAFLGATTGTGTGSSLSMYLGPETGPLRRIVGAGDPVPGSAALLSNFLPPSGINAGGALAIPVALADGTDVVLGWDGAALIHVAGEGDVIPGAGEILEIRGAPLLPPVLDDAGTVLFTATTEAGGAGLYEAPLVEDGYRAARRVLGAGDAVEGGLLVPFRLRMMARDAAGRLAVQVAPAPGSQFATYYGTGLPASVIAPGAVLPGGGTVSDVLPHLAAAGDEGVLHEVSGAGYVLLLAVPPPADDPGAGFTQITLVRPGLPSPDGGTYLPWGRAGPIGGQPSVPDRLASNGGRYAAMLTLTSAGRETLVLFDLRPDRAPAADAGPDQVIECTGPAGAAVTLDGTASVDPEGGALGFEWSGPFGIVTGAQATVTVPLGTWVVTLTVRDAGGAVATDTVTITVRDTVAPSLVVRAAPPILWPPDGRLRGVAFGTTAADVCDRAPLVVLESIAIEDPKGSDPATDIAGAAYGTFDPVVMLRARRSGGGDRTYVVTYRATDDSGNATAATAAVVVPLSRSN